MTERGKAAFTLKRESDVVSLCALLLAATAAISQFQGWVRGPRLEMLGPEKALIFAAHVGGKNAIRIAAPMSYVNLADQSYSAVLAREKVTIESGKFISTQEWNGLGDIKSGPSGIYSDFVSPSLPMGISGQSAISHVTLFTPSIPQCYSEVDCPVSKNIIDPGDLWMSLAAGQKIRLLFEAEFYAWGKLKRDCYVFVTKAMAERLHSSATPAPIYATCRLSET